MQDLFANVRANSPSSNRRDQERQGDHFHHGYLSLPSLGHDNTTYTNHAEGAYLTEESLQALINILENISDRDLENYSTDPRDETLRPLLFTEIWAYLVRQENGLDWKIHSKNKGKGRASKELGSTVSHFTPGDEEDFISPSDLIKFLLKKTHWFMKEACQSKVSVICTKLLAVLEELTSNSRKKKRKCTATSTPPASPAPTDSQKKKKSGSTKGTAKLAKTSTKAQSGKRSALSRKGNSKNDSSNTKKGSFNVIDGAGGDRISQLAMLVSWLRAGYINQQQFEDWKKEILDDLGE